MNEQELINSLKTGNKTTLKNLYLLHKDTFSSFAKKFSGSKNEILDIYQDAIIILFEKAIDGKLDNLKCSLKTYLFSIGKNMIYNKLKENNKMVLMHSKPFNDVCEEDISFDVAPLNTYQKQLQTAFRLLGNQCKEILTLFYYQGYNLDEITITLGYEKKDVVKSQKSRCLKQLKSLIKKNG